MYTGVHVSPIADTVKVLTWEMKNTPQLPHFVIDLIKMIDPLK